MKVEQRLVLEHDIKNLKGTSSIRDGVKKVLNTLGYSSNRSMNVENLHRFMELVGRDLEVKHKQRLSKVSECWNDVQVVFQLTNSEIQGRHEEVFDASRINSFLFLAVDLKSQNGYTRQYLADTTRVLNKCFQMPVIVIFRYNDLLTFSVIHRRASKRDQIKDVLERVTLIKDVDTTQPHRAHLDILESLSFANMWTAGVRNFDDLHVKWEKTLEIQELNNRFYRELLGWFRWASDTCVFPNDHSGPKSVQRHVIRLITRLLFIWFLKEMGLIPREIFEEQFACSVLRSHSKDSTDYYQAILQNLFFATLNTEMNKRSFGIEANETSTFKYLELLENRREFRSKFESIPFVNGGLFDCLDEIGDSGEVVIDIEAYSECPNNSSVLSVPAELFFHSQNGLFTIFNRFKFTLEESTPLDCEVALDPELLGCVFENLLDTYDPTTGDQERKLTGSYYTPRNVVNYMVRKALTETLIETIQTIEDTGWWRDRLNYLLDHNKAMDDADKFFEDQEKGELVSRDCRH